MIVGITGNSGSGKTKVSGIIAKKINADIIDADKIAKDMFNNKNTIYYKKIEEHFGEKISRKELANIVYKDKEKLQILNSITKEYIVKEILIIIEKNKQKNLVLDIPLLFESNLDKVCDVTIAIIASKNIKIERICKRDNISKQEAEARLSIQPKEEYYIAKANYVIDNNCDDVTEQIKRILF